MEVSDHLKFRKMVWTYTIMLLNLIADASYDQKPDKQMLTATHPDITPS